MATELIINSSLPETRIALMENGEIQDMIIERAGDRGIVGNIYKGRVTRVLPGMQAAFVDIGLEKAAFLYVDDIHEHEGMVEDEGDSREMSPEESNEESNEGPNEGPNEGSPNEDSPNEDSNEASSTDDSSGESLEGSEQGNQDESSPDETSDDTQAEGSDSDDIAIDDPVEMSEDPSDGSDQKSEGVVAEPGASAGPKGGRAPRAAAGRGGRGGRRWGRNRRPAAGQKAAQGSTADEGGSGDQGQSHNQSGEPAQDLSTDVADHQTPESYSAHVADTGDTASDRSEVTENGDVQIRPELHREENPLRQKTNVDYQKARGALRQQRGRDRKVAAWPGKRGYDRYSEKRVNIQDLLKEGQEVLVQVSKDPIATKGARLTCHISLPGRHLVCMPTINHVGISRRIERDDERRRLREYVIRNRQNLGFEKMGFIVRTASGGKDPEKWIRQDIDYLGKLWSEIRSRVNQAAGVLP